MKGIPRRLTVLNKLLFLACTLIINAKLSAQVSVITTAEKLANGKYRISLQILPLNGYHIYAGDSAVGIPGLKIETGTATQEDIDGTVEGIITERSDPIFNGNKVGVYLQTVTVASILQFDTAIPDSVRGTLEGFAGTKENFIPISVAFAVALPGGIQQANTILKLPTVNLQQPLNRCAEPEKESRSIMGIFLLGFLGGLVALFTPCVFPMVPVTVSFFAHRSGSRTQGIQNGVLYGAFILLIYLLAGLPFHFIGNLRPELLNNIATSGALNLIFFVVFLAFALSFFGLFQFRLPASIANRADSKSSLGSITGIFFMALTLAIASFSCTGPILGSLLVGTASIGAWPLTAGLAGFGLALALPFAVFAIFPQLLKSLPKSGGWMDIMKKILAFIELALALKFLSNADLVMHWGILKREIFIAVWILIGLGLGIYLLTIPLTRLSRKPIMIAAVTVLLFCVYLVPGLTATGYANLCLLSGIAPPLSYSVYAESAPHVKADVINDYERAVGLAKKQNKKLLIDFTGWACVNCRKMEEQVWTKPEISQVIKDEFILVSLYVDDKAPLPAHEQTGTLKTVGDKWAAFQSQNFGQVSQPLYVILDPEERLVNSPIGYTPDADKYIAWLQCGLSTPLESHR